MQTTNPLARFEAYVAEIEEQLAIFRRELALEAWHSINYRKQTDRQPGDKPITVAPSLMSMLDN